MIVAIDDQRPCLEADVVIRKALRAEEILFSIAFNTPIDELWLDHDLGIEYTLPQDTRAVIKAIEEDVNGANNHFPGYMKIRILSDNPVGRVYIRKALERYFEVLP